MKAIIKLFLEYLPLLVKASAAVPEILAFIRRTQETLKQTKEWTAAEQEQFDRDVETVTSQPHWQAEPFIEPPHP